MPSLTIKSYSTIVKAAARPAALATRDEAGPVGDSAIIFVGDA